MNWNLVFHLKRTSKESLNLRRQYYVIWHASPLSLNPTASIPLSWWDGWWWMCVRNRGREGRIIPSEYVMNVVIGLKLTGGTSGARRARACMWVTASTIIDSLLQPLSVSLTSPPKRDTENRTRRSKREAKTLLPFLYCFFFLKITKLSEAKEEKDSESQKWSASFRRLQPTQSLF